MVRIHSLYSQTLGTTVLQLAVICFHLTSTKIDFAIQNYLQHAPLGIFLPKMSQWTDGFDIFKQGLSSQSGALQPHWHLPEDSKSDRCATSALFTYESMISMRMYGIRGWRHYGEFRLLSATSSGIQRLWVSNGLKKHIVGELPELRPTLAVVGTKMRFSDPPSVYVTVRWALSSFRCLTMAPCERVSNPPDMNPIERLWGITYHRIHLHHIAQQSVQKVTDVLIQLWEEILQETIHHLIEMPRHPRERIHTCGHTMSCL